MEDLPIIVAGQIELENQKLVKANRLLFCDTNVLLTRVWSETHFDGYCDPAIIDYSKKFKYDLYLLTGIDVPWVKDDLRDRPNDRQLMFDYFLKVLKEQGAHFAEISGSMEERLKKAILMINTILLK